MSDAAHPGWAVYDLDRLHANLAEIRRRSGPGQAFIAALKGNAYGHGAVAVARALDREGLAAFMTGSFDEGCRLRSEGLRTPVVMFAGALPAGMADLVGAGLVPTVVDRAGAEAAARAAPPGETVPVYVKVNAGLGRLGVPLEATEDFLLDLAAIRGLEVRGLYTHLPFGDCAGATGPSKDSPPSTRFSRASKSAGWRRRSPRQARALPLPPDCRIGPMRSAPATCSTACRHSPMPRLRTCRRSGLSWPRSGAGWYRSPTIPREAISRSAAATEFAAAGAPASRRSASPRAWPVLHRAAAGGAHTRPAGPDPRRVAGASGPGPLRCRGRRGRRCRVAARRELRVGDRTERAGRLVRDERTRRGDGALRPADRALSRRGRRDYWYLSGSARSAGASEAA